MTDKPNNLNEQLKMHGQAIQGSLTGISDAGKRAIANIDKGFNEAQRRIDEMQQLADYVAGTPNNGMNHQHLGIVHGSEYVISEADYKARRKLLDKHYQSEKFTRSTNDDGEVVVTINVPTRENKDG